MAVVFFKYLEWYFIDKTLEILSFWKRVSSSYFKYFSIPILIKTFFSPWKRISLEYGRGIDIKRYVEAFTFNVMSRVIGAIIRTFFLLISVIAEVLILIGGALVLIFWLIAPILFFLGIFLGFYLITGGEIYEI